MIRINMTIENLNELNKKMKTMMMMNGIKTMTDTEDLKENNDLNKWNDVDNVEG